MLNQEWNYISGIEVIFAFFLRLDKSELTEKWRQTRKKSNRKLVLVEKFLAGDRIYIAVSWDVRDEDPINMMVVMMAKSSAAGCTRGQLGNTSTCSYMRFDM